MKTLINTAIITTALSFSGILFANTHSTNSSSDITIQMRDAISTQITTTLSFNDDVIVLARHSYHGGRSVKYQGAGYRGGHHGGYRGGHGGYRGGHHGGGYRGHAGGWNKGGYHGGGHYGGYNKYHGGKYHGSKYYSTRYYGGRYYGGYPYYYGNPYYNDYYYDNDWDYVAPFIFGTIVGGAIASQPTYSRDCSVYYRGKTRYGVISRSNGLCYITYKGKKIGFRQ